MKIRGTTSSSASLLTEKINDLWHKVVFFCVCALCVCVVHFPRIKRNSVVPPRTRTWRALPTEWLSAHLALMCVFARFLPSLFHTSGGTTKSTAAGHAHTHTSAAACLSCPISSDCTGALGRTPIHPVPSRPDRGRKISAAAVWLQRVCVDVAPSQLRAAGLEMQTVTAGVPPGAGSESNPCPFRSLTSC